jgi:hypothetical protein
VDFLSTLTQIFLLVLSVGLFFWLIKHVISVYIFSRRKEEINGLHARISILKLHLRTKVRKKLNRVENALKRESDILALATPQIEILQNINFDQISDYQKTLDTLYELTILISKHVRTKHKNLLRTEKLLEVKDEEPKVLTAEDEVREKCRKLVKYDKANVTIILDIAQTTQTLIQKIDEYNELTGYESAQAKIADKPKAIEIRDFDQLNLTLEEAKNDPQDRPDFPILEKSLFEDDAA